MSEELKKFRMQIDRIDDELLRLFNERARLAQQIGHLKGDDDDKWRADREAQILRRMQQQNNGPLPNEGIAQLYTEIMSQCRTLEAPLTVAYLGPQGTFSEAAVFQRFGQATKGLPVDSIDTVFSTVEHRTANYGVVPVENSTEGAVTRTLDLMLDSNLKICGEIMLPVHQCLLAKRGGPDLLDRIKKVYSHPQSLAQCRDWLNTNLKNVDRIPVTSNAEAARLAAEDDSGAAIAGVQAAAHFGLGVLAENIEDDPRNTTRFLVIGDQEVAPGGRDKTSLVMSAPNRPGAMHDLLAPLAQHGVSMTKLESRPSRTGMWEYVFYVDLEGHQLDANVAAALEGLKRVAAFVKVLGSYPVAA